MLNGNGKLSSVSATNVCRKDGDVLLRTYTLETSQEELHKRVPLLLNIGQVRKLHSSLKFAFSLLI